MATTNRRTRKLKLLPEAKNIIETSKRPNRDLWAMSYFRNMDVELWRLVCTDGAEVAMYMSKDRIISGTFGNEDMFGRNPVFHVWKEDEHIYCGQSEQAAQRKYVEAKRELGL